MITDKKNILLKSYAVGALVFLFSIYLIYRVVKIQVTEGDELMSFAQHNNFRLATEEAGRGNLYASNGILLATTVTKHNIYIDLKTVKPELFEKEVSGLADSLGKMFNKQPSYFEQKLRKEKRKENRYMLLVRGLDYDAYQRIKTFPIFNKGQNKGGFIHETESKRELVMKDVGARTIGFDDGRGKSGLEGAYSSYLKGVDGKRWEQFMGGGKWKPFKRWEQEPKPGAEVYTTIDADLQMVAYDALNAQLTEYNAQHGCVVVMEVATGKIKAIVNLQKMKDGSYADVYNYAVGEAAEPGSTFKTVSLLAGLDDEKFKENSTVETGKGSYSLYGRTITDTHANGTLTVKQVLEKSSNIGTAKLINAAYGSNPEDYIDKLETWKLTKPLKIDIPGEGKPQLFTPQSKEWSKVTLPIMGYGYGFKLTPIQILTFYNGIANNGVMLKPLFIDKIVRDKYYQRVFRPQVLVKEMASPEAINAIQDMLLGAVEDGTAKNIKSDAYGIAGKTGTARVEYWIKNQPMQYRASFAGYFPANKPEYSCVVVIHKPDRSKGYYGGGVTGPVFKKIADWVYARTLKQVPNTPTVENVNKKIQSLPTLKVDGDKNTIPNVTGFAGMSAIPALENLGLDVKYTGIGKVVSQSIPAGTKFNKGQTIYLTLGK